MTEKSRYGEQQTKGPSDSLQEELSRVNRELRRAEELFNAVTDDALIETCTYRIQTLMAYRAYLLRTARQETQAQAPVTL